MSGGCDVTDEYDRPGMRDQPALIGTRSQRVVSTAKHLALRAHEKCSAREDQLGPAHLETR
jgi:hypothetical protein